MPRRPPRRRGQTGVGPCAGAGRGARFPQRPGLGDCSHRHDRPGDGLRYHRHRTRFLAGQVQEAGGRRATSRSSTRPSPRRCRTLGYDEAAIARIVNYAVGHGSLAKAPAINHETLAARGFDAATIGRVEKSIGTAFDIRFAFSRYTLGDAFCRDVARTRRRRRSPIPSSTCLRASASPRATSRRRTCMPAGR